MNTTSTPQPPACAPRSLLLAGAAALASPLALAQSDWPTKPVTIVVPFPAGGGTDAFARPLTARADQEPRPAVHHRQQGRRRRHAWAPASRPRAAPDGYTFFMGAVHHAIAPSMYPKLDYNIETDFVPVGLVVQRAAGDRGQPAARAGDRPARPCSTSCARTRAS